MFIGIDLGTSGVKLLLVSKDGKVIKSISKTYPIYYSNGNWSEQYPHEWWFSTKEGIKELIKDIDKGKVKGISFSGQMHGLVMLDEENEVIRPAILWNDGRCQKETDYLNNVIGKEKLIKYTGNIAFAGFTAPKILWIKKHEPENFKKIKMLLLPKDYLVYCFTGLFSTDYSDASGTLLLDVKNKKWSKEMCDIIGVDESQLPTLHESYDFISVIKEDIAKELGLSLDVKIIAGAGDNAAAAVGTGTVNNGSCNISLGTSGTIFISNDKYVCDNKFPIHSFAHANGKYHLMECILSAASCNKWWIEEILQSSYQKEQQNLSELMGKNDIYFLPYLMGERCPHNDTDARGGFIGIRANTTRGQLTLAVMEGVAFALKECLDIVEKINSEIFCTTLCGGGAKSVLWANIIANVLNKPVNFVETEQGPGFGAAILAMVGCGEYETIESATKKIVHIVKIINPSNEIAKKYQAKFEIYKKLYQSLKTTFKIWN